MSEVGKFHQAVEEILETDGEDIGRFKNTAMANELAETINYSLDRGMSKEAIDRSIDEDIVEGLAHAALTNPAQAENDYHRLQDEAKRIAEEASR
ncbi:MAG TPA: hypothetical protein VGE13_02295 [Candidatus Saccharimonadales bacterium]